MDGAAKASRGWVGHVSRSQLRPKASLSNDIESRPAAQAPRLQKALENGSRSRAPRVHTLMQLSCSPQGSSGVNRLRHPYTPCAEIDHISAQRSLLCVASGIDTQRVIDPELGWDGRRLAAADRQCGPA